MSETTTSVVARWDADQEMYLLDSEVFQVWSTDGETWHDDYGGQPHGEEWQSLEVTLAGGPRDGDIMA